jgi:hypothetical protein
MLTFVVGLGNFAHCHQRRNLAAPDRPRPEQLRALDLLRVAGNVCGVGMVTLLEYGWSSTAKSCEAEAITPLAKEKSQPNSRSIDTRYKIRGGCASNTEGSRLRENERPEASSSMNCRFRASPGESASRQSHRPQPG